MKLPIKLPAKLTRFFGKTMLKLQKNSPEICIVTGILLGGTAIVVTGVKTWKGKETLSKDIEEIKKEKEILKEITSIDPTTEQTAMISKEKVALQKKKLASAYVDTAKDITKTYWLPVLLSIGSVSFTWGGRLLFRREIGALATLLAAATERYNQLYDRIKNNYGEEMAQKLLYGAEKIDIPTEDGNEESQSLTTIAKTNANLSPYAFWFDPGEYDQESGEWIWKNSEWNHIKPQNMATVRSIQREFTNELYIRGWVLLGEVAKRFGVKPNEAWNRVGWVWKEGQNNQIEFRVLEGPYQLPFNKGFMDLRNPQNVCIIEPNVDGCIDYVFRDIERYDKRVGKRRKKLPSPAEMFGEEYAKKLD